MSYDVWMYADLGAGGVAVGHLDRNYTYNCGPMLVEATGGTSLRDLNDEPGAKVGPILRAALSAMELDRPKYLAMNPENGWGDLDGWMTFLRDIADACEAAPQARLRVG